MTSKELYQQRKAQGLCVICCSPAVAGKTRCEFCAKMERKSEKIRRNKMTAEQKAKRKIYLKNWQANNPEKMAVYKSRKAEYNRRYFYGCEL